MTERLRLAKPGIMKSNKAYLCILELLVLAFFFLNYKVHDVSILDVVKVFLYQLFAWGVTGYAVMRMLKVKAKNFLQVLALSYTIGAVTALLFYLVFMLPGIGFLLPYFTILESGLAVFYIIKSKADIEEYESDSFDKVICFVFLVVLLFVTFFVVSLVNVMPSETPNGTGYYVDWLFWAGNNIAFTRNFPSDCFRQPGVTFNYHYLSSLLMAHTSLCTGVSVNLITFYFSGILAPIVFVLSAYYFASVVSRRKLMIAILMGAMIFTDGSTITYIWHTTICPFGFDYSMAYAMMSIGMLYEILINDRFKDLFVPSIFFLGMTTGCKGPIGVIVLAAYGVAAIIMLVRKQFKLGLLCGILWSAAFIVVYYTFINSEWVTQSAQGLEYIGGLGINDIFSNQPLVQRVYNALLTAYRLEEDSVFLQIYTIWLYLYRTNKVVMVLFIISIIVLIRGILRKKCDSLLVCLTVPSLIGIVLNYYTMQSGYSQMYFLMGIYPVATFAGVYAIQELGDDLVSRGKSRLLYTGALALVLLSLGQSGTMCYDTLYPKFVDGINIERNLYSVDEYTCYSIDAEEYEVCEWLRDNTDEDCLIALDSHVNIAGKENSMIVGVFTERYIWNEEKYLPDIIEGERRSDIMQQIWCDPNRTIQILRDEGVDYVLVMIGDNKPDLCSMVSDVNEVYRNLHYVVYSI